MFDDMPKPFPKKVQTTISLYDDLLDEIKAISKRDNTPVSTLIERALLNSYLLRSQDPVKVKFATRDVDAVNRKS